jgi:anti-anti-sigma regulatory factor
MNSFPRSNRAPLRVEAITEGDTTRIVLHGEADISNVDHLTTALTGIKLDGTRSVQIDASDLAFFDIATLRSLTVFVQLVKQAGRDITTRPATPLLRRVARMLELEDELGLR